MRSLVTFCAALLMSASVWAQQPQPAPSAPAAPPAAPAPAPTRPASPPAPSPRPAPAERPPQARPAPVAPPAPAPPPALTSVGGLNVLYEISLRDTGGAQPGTKTVTMTATGGATSSVRASGTLTGRGTNPLNVDVMPNGERDGKVHTYIGLEYVPQSPGAAGPPPLSVRQTLHVWLESGKPTMVSRATDPNSDRRIEVTVTATILK